MDIVVLLKQVPATESLITIADDNVSIKTDDIKSVTVTIMEVPCCFGLYQLVTDAIKESNMDIPLTKIVIGVKGDILEQ